MNYLQQLLVYEWDLDLINNTTGRVITLPLVIQLSWIQSIKLRKILLSEFTVQLMYSAASNLKEFHFTQNKRDSNNHTPQLPLQLDASDDKVAKIYPTL